MTRSTAASYWADTAIGYFEFMTPRYEPGEAFPISDHAHLPRRDLHLPRGRLLPIKPTQEIINAIAACAPEARDALSQAVPRQAKAMAFL